jgi:hypothetical protein
VIAWTTVDGWDEAANTLARPIPARRTPGVQKRLHGGFKPAQRTRKAGFAGIFRRPLNHS